MRHNTYLWAMVSLALCACNTDLESDPVASRTEALAQPFDPLICTLGDACEQWGELIEEPSAEPFACTPLSGEALPASWYVPLGGVPCPFGTCAALDAQLAVEPSGSVVALFIVELPTPMGGYREGGGWLARYASDGQNVGSYLWDYAIPPPGVEVQRNARLVKDASGDVVLATSRVVLPSEGPQPVAIAKLRKQQAPKPQGASLKTPPTYPMQTVIGPNGEILVMSWYSFGALEEQRSMLTLHDRRGRVVWNRPWPPGATIQSVHIDPAERITVEYMTGEPWDGGYGMVARLDLDGRVIWQRAIGEPEVYVQTAVDREGNVFAMTARWIFETFEARLERIDALGRSTAVWDLSQLGTYPELHRGRDGARMLVRIEQSAAPELWMLPFNAASSASACEGRRHLWPGTHESLFAGAIAFADNDQSQVYIATTSEIFQLAGGAP